MVRRQWCREHIDQVAEECGLSRTAVSDIKQADDFSKKYVEFSTVATSPIVTLIRIKQEPIKERAISLAQKFLNEETPTGGKKNPELTANKVREIIKQADLEVRAEYRKSHPEENTESQKSVVVGHDKEGHPLEVIFDGGGDDKKSESNGNAPLNEWKSSADCEGCNDRREMKNGISQCMIGIDGRPIACNLLKECCRETERKKEELKKQCQFHQGGDMPKGGGIIRETKDTRTEVKEESACKPVLILKSPPDPAGMNGFPERIEITPTGSMWRAVKDKINEGIYPTWRAAFLGELEKGLFGRDQE